MIGSLLHHRTGWSVLVLCVSFLSIGHSASAQCDPTVPTYFVDLTSSPNSTFLSPSGTRVGNCCGTTAPDACVAFIITLHPGASGIIFDICSGAVPSGSMFYQIGCGPPTAVGSVMCLNGVGPHTLTFCKPGNNPNSYCVTSVPAPTAGPDISINDGCSATMFATGFDTTTIQWTSVVPGATGQYDAYMDCNTCSQVNVGWQAGAPAFVDYQICGSPIGGCGQTPTCDTVRVYFNPSLAASIQPPFPTVCFGAAGTTIHAIPGGGSPPYSYLWSTGETTPSIFVGPGTYSVQISDSTNCPPVNTSVIVDAFAIPITADAGNDITVCGTNGQVALSGTVTGALGGYWSSQGSVQLAPDSLNVAYTPTLAELQQGSSTLYLTTTGNSGCPADIDTLVVHWSALTLSAILISDHISCTGNSDGAISFTPADPALTYSWNDPAGQSTATATGLGAGTYTVTVSDLNGCDTSLSLTLVDPAPFVVDSIAGVDLLCNQDSSGQAYVYVSGGTPGYTYQWGGLASGQITDGISQLSVGSYPVTITDLHGCVVNSSVSIAQPPPLLIDLPPVVPVCVNTPFDLSANASGGTPGYVFIWAGYGSADTLTTSISSDSSFTVTVSDANGCLGPSDSVLIEVIDIFSETLSAWGDTVLCGSGQVNFGAQFSGDLSITTIDWPSIGNTGEGPFTQLITQSGSIPVLATDVCGNSLYDTVLVIVDELPVISMPSILEEGCAPLEVQFPSIQTNALLTYSWQFGDGSTSTQDAPTHTYSAGNYVVMVNVTTVNGCVIFSPSPSAVNAFAPPIAKIDADPWTTDIDNPTIQLTDASIGNIAFREWTFPDGTTSNINNPIYVADQIGSLPIHLFVRDLNHCEATDHRLINVLPVYDITIPNAFTPSAGSQGGGYYTPGDLSNDIFYPFVDYVDQMEFLIFNRWGELVFESHDPAFGWDGYYKGKLSQQDVYTYSLWVRFKDGVEQEKVGDVSLFR